MWHECPDQFSLTMGSVHIGPEDGPGKAARGQMIKGPVYSRGRPRNPLKQERKTWAQSGSKGEGMFEGTEAAGW